jgi:adenylate kinase family enzyme
MVDHKIIDPANPDVILLKLDVPDEVVVSRISNRRTDPVTGKGYHLINYPPPADVAARCVIRPDDTVERVSRRLDTYHRLINSIVHELTTKGKLSLSVVSPDKADPDNAEKTMVSIRTQLGGKIASRM